MLTVVLREKGETARPAVQSPSGAGLVLESPPQFYRIESVVPGSRAAAAGIEPGDRVVRIDHAEPRSLAQVQRALATDGALPMLLEVARADRRIAILVR
jgi:membrane-associated protease RseP (regulator of RpoE activity)